jgi:hypothetical protein
VTITATVGEGSGLADLLALLARLAASRTRNAGRVLDARGWTLTYTSSQSKMRQQGPSRAHPSTSLTHSHVLTIC